jgi:TnpA family transposase
MNVHIQSRNRSLLKLARRLVWMVSRFSRHWMGLRGTSSSIRLMARSAMRRSTIVTPALHDAALGGDPAVIGYGGIGYYMVSDSYIALMSRFTTCGSWEGHYILDFLKENESEVKPDTIHADTQGQSTAIFGLAYLLGVQLMPRIRNWKEQKFFRVMGQDRYEHIDDLFKGIVDAELIETMLPEMLRVVVSIKAGTILPSDILRRMNSHSRKNRLYFALRELGRVVRTVFLLTYISDLELRHVQTATTKSERFNRFVQWVPFGGDSVIAENVRDEQRKFIKYNHLVANLLVFHNLVGMTRAMQKMQADGHLVSDELAASLSPYPTEHINRFGNYNPNFGRSQGRSF